MKAPWSPEKSPFGNNQAKKLYFFTIISQLSESLEKASSTKLGYGSTAHSTRFSSYAWHAGPTAWHAWQLGPWIEIPDISFPQPLMFAWSKLDRPDSPADLVGLAGLAGIAGPAAN